MNKQPIEAARDTDLRQSGAAMQRAAQRARQLAQQTGTLLVVSRHGVLEQIRPEAGLPVRGVHEPTAPYGGTP
jgi:hypothetical protein